MKNQEAEVIRLILLTFAFCFFELYYMNELLQTFGIEPVLLLAQIVNFLIIFYLLKRFAWKPILKTLEDRKNTIAEGLKNAELADKRLEEAVEKEREVLKKAQSEAQNLLTDAKKQSLEIHQEAEEKAKLAAEKIIADGHKKIEEQVKEAEKMLAKQVTKVAIEILEKSLQDIFDTKQQKAVLSKAAKKLKS